jgi:hypothetical protein
MIMLRKHNILKLFIPCFIRQSTQFGNRTKALPFIGFKYTPTVNSTYHHKIFQNKPKMTQKIFAFVFLFPSSIQGEAFHKAYTQQINSSEPKLGIGSKKILQW